MDLISTLAFVFVAALLVISPGPNGLLVTKTVSIAGRRAGFANVLGFMPAFFIHGTLSIFGISILLVQSAQAFFVFKMLGAAYLCWLGVKSFIAVYKGRNTLTQAATEPKKSTVTIHTAFAEGFLTNILNPKVSMFYLAAFPQFLSHSDNAFNAYLLVSLHALTNLVWFSLLIVLLAKLKKMGSSPSFQTWLHSITGTVFLSFGIKLAFLKAAE